MSEWRGSPEHVTDSQSESAMQATPSPQGDSEWRGSSEHVTDPQSESVTQAPDTQEMNSTAYNEMVSMMGERLTMAAAMPEADAVSSPVLDLLDIAGYNYAVSRYEKEGEAVRMTRRTEGLERNIRGCLRMPARCISSEMTMRKRDWRL